MTNKYVENKFKFVRNWTKTAEKWAKIDQNIDLK